MLLNNTLKTSIPLFKDPISGHTTTITLTAKVVFWRIKKEKNREVTMPLPRVYFFFAGAFFTSFLTGFLAI
jgi:hypothetical protein